MMACPCLDCRILEANARKAAEIGDNALRTVAGEKKASAMPSLPERKRPGSAMPSLPARPSREISVHLRFPSLPRRHVRKALVCLSGSSWLWESLPELKLMRSTAAF